MYGDPATPAGNEVDVTVSDPPITIDNVCVAVRDPLSVTPTVKFEVPALVGVPLITPAVDSDNPAGKVPVETAQVYGAVPPTAARVVEV